MRRWWPPHDAAADDEVWCYYGDGNTSRSRQFQTSMKMSAGVRDARAWSEEAKRAFSPVSEKVNGGGRRRMANGGAEEGDPSLLDAGAAVRFHLFNVIVDQGSSRLDPQQISLPSRKRPEEG